ncbi:FtsW/RodA/SpoVE family cell cycle protein [Candidatus Saccharibacteria bacterium]|nr:FtsW/RodA/SpoVE family cell cycle protein [Candidatus Saccharibacteria bacterium]
MRIRSTQPDVRRHRPDYQLIAAIAALLIVGLVTLFAIGPRQVQFMNGLGHDLATQHFFWRQFRAVILGVAAFLFMSKFPYKWLIRLATAIFIGAILANLVLWVASTQGWSIAPQIGGAYRWLRFGPLSIQPSELLKVSLAIWLPTFLARQRQLGHINDWFTFGIATAAVGVAAFFTAITQSDLGTTIVVAAIGFAIMFFSGISYKKLFGLIAVALLAGGLFMISSPFRRARIETFLQGEAIVYEVTAENFHARQALLAVSQGGLTGVGIGDSVFASGYLPESLNDSIFAILGEIFGFVGLMGILGLYGWLFMRMLRTVALLHDYTARLIAAGIFAWIAVQVLINIFAMTSLIPITGIVLPLLSYGGTSMLIILAVLGLIFQLSRYTGCEVIKPEQEEVTDTSPPRPPKSPRSPLPPKPKPPKPSTPTPPRRRRTF